MNIQCYNFEYAAKCLSCVYAYETSQDVELCKECSEPLTAMTLVRHCTSCAEMLGTLEEIATMRQKLADYESLGTYERVAYLCGLGEIYEHAEELGLE